MIMKQMNNFFLMLLLLLFLVNLIFAETIFVNGNDKCDFYSRKTFTTIEAPLSQIGGIGSDFEGKFYFFVPDEGDDAKLHIWRYTPNTGEWYEWISEDTSLATYAYFASHPTENEIFISVSMPWVTYSAGYSWNKASLDDSVGFSTPVYATINEEISLLTYNPLVNNFLYKWTGNPPLLEKQTQYEFNELSRVYNVTDLGNEDIFVLGTSLGGSIHPVILRASGSLTNWDLMTVHGNLFGTPKQIMKTPDGGFLVAYNLGLPNRRIRILRSEDGENWYDAGIEIDYDYILDSAYNETGAYLIVAEDTEDYPVKIFRFKSSKEDANTPIMYGEIPLNIPLGTQMYHIEAGNSKSLMVSYNMQARELKCNSQPILEDRNVSGIAGQPVTIDASNAFDFEGDEITFEWQTADGGMGELETGSSYTFVPTESGKYIKWVNINDNGAPHVNNRTVYFTINVSEPEQQSPSPETVPDENSPPVNPDNNPPDNQPTNPPDNGGVEPPDNSGVIPDNNNPPQNPVNNPPVLQADESQAGIVGMPMTLHALAVDSEGSTITFEWEQISGPEVELLENDSAEPVFFPTEEGEYVFEVTAIDSQGKKSLPQTVTASIISNNASANPFGDLSELGNALILAGTAIIIVVVIVLGAIVFHSKSKSPKIKKSSKNKK